MDWQIFISVFTTIFLAELPDKTALIILLIAARGQPFASFVGVSLAFLVQNVVAVALGQTISLLPQHWVHLGAGVMFVGFALHMWFSSAPDETELKPSSEGSQRALFLRPAAQAFMAVFIAEWGDLTQLATASFAARSPEQTYGIFLAATLALWSVTGVLFIVGYRMRKWVRGPWLKKAGAVIFAMLGVYFLWSN